MIHSLRLCGGSGIVRYTMKSMSKWRRFLFEVERDPGRCASRLGTPAYTPSHIHARDSGFGLGAHESCN